MGNYDDSNFGEYFNPNNSVVHNVGEGFFPPLNTSSFGTNDEFAHMPMGDVVHVSTTNAARISISKQSTTSSSRIDTNEKHVDDQPMSANAILNKNQTGPMPNVHPIDENPAPKSYVGATTGTNDTNTKRKSNFHAIKVDNVFNGVDVSTPRKVVENISTKFDLEMGESGL